MSESSSSKIWHTDTDKMEDKYIVFGKPKITDEDIDSVVSTLKSGWLSTGPKVHELEENIKQYIGCKHTIALNSCTSALHLALLCNGIGPGDEVIVPSMTFAATVNVIEHVGAKPVFVDIESDSYNIDAEQIESKINKNTKAIVAVHFGGLPCDLDRLNEISKKHSIILIEDAAHSIGASYKGRPIGKDNIACFSFYVTKNIAAGEGGIICLNDDKLAEKIRRYALHGLSLNAWERFGKSEKKSYQIICPGYKYNMQDINASLIIPQLFRIEHITYQRRIFADMYNTSFVSNDLITIPPNKNDCINSWHLYPILLNLEQLTITRDEFIKLMDKAGIGTGIHYEAIHQQPYYQNKYNIKKGGLPRTEFVSERTVSIPLQLSIRSKDVLDIILTVNKILRSHRKK